LNELNCSLQFRYPVHDNQLEILMIETFKPPDAAPLKTNTMLLMGVYNAKHSFDSQIDFSNPGISTCIVSKISHFKNAMREFSWAKDG
jgi:hypothetical protein